MCRCCLTSMSTSLSNTSFGTTNGRWVNTKCRSVKRLYSIEWNEIKYQTMEKYDCRLTRNSFKRTHFTPVSWHRCKLSDSPGNPFERIAATNVCRFLPLPVHCWSKCNANARTYKFTIELRLFAVLWSIFCFSLRTTTRLTWKCIQIHTRPHEYKQQLQSLWICCAIAIENEWETKKKNKWENRTENCICKMQSSIGDCFIWMANGRPNTYTFTHTT